MPDKVDTHRNHQAVRYFASVQPGVTKGGNAAGIRLTGMTGAVELTAQEPSFVGHSCRRPSIHKDGRVGQAHFFVGADPAKVLSPLHPLLRARCTILRQAPSRSGQVT